MSLTDSADDWLHLKTGTPNHIPRICQTPSKEGGVGEIAEMVGGAIARQLSKRLSSVLLIQNWQISQAFRMACFTDILLPPYSLSNLRLIGLIA